MKENKINLFLLTTSVLSIIMLIIGGTYSYFNMRTMSKLNAVAVEAGKIKVGLGVSPIYTGYKLIPANDEDIMTAYNQNCLDDYDNGACLAYGLEIFNFSNNMQEVFGTINFNLQNIENLSYLILDENNNIYLDSSKVTANNELTLGPSFAIDGVPTGGTSNSKKFTLIIWLSNLNEDQTPVDAGGTFSATVTYSSIYGGKLTATISGTEKESSTPSQIGGDE